VIPREEGPPPAEGERERGPRGRRPWPAWVLGGAVAGAVIGIAVTGGPAGFWLGAVIGGVTEALMAIVANSLRGRWEGSLLVCAAAVLCGSGVGLLAGLVLKPSPAAGALIGALVGVLDAVLTWVLFPGGATPGRRPAEDGEPDDDLSDPEEDASEW
jgi:hypothetical protein